MFAEKTRTLILDWCRVIPVTSISIGERGTPVTLFLGEKTWSSLILRSSGSNVKAVTVIKVSSTSLERSSIKKMARDGLKRSLSRLRNLKKYIPMSWKK